MNLRTSATGFGTAPILAILGLVLLSDCRTVDPQLSDRIVEIRVYTLKTGTRDRFHELFLRDALPMLQRRRVDVLAHGPSLHDADSYFLLRSYASLDERTRSQDAFYGSAEWTQGPRDALLSSIDRYSTAVVRLDEAALEGLRRTGPGGRVPNGTQGADMPHTDHSTTGTASDVAALVALNDDYIRAVQTSDVRRFREILAEDFLCSLPDGSQVDRETFLRQIAQPATISNLQAHDVNVRVLGDVALVHARTTFTKADGQPGASRYTDVWARRDGRWVAVAAQVTRY